MTDISLFAMISVALFHKGLKHLMQHSYPDASFSSKLKIMSIKLACDLSQIDQIKCSGKNWALKPNLQSRSKHLKTNDLVEFGQDRKPGESPVMGFDPLAFQVHLMDSGITRRHFNSMGLDDQGALIKLIKEIPSTGHRFSA